MAAALLLGAVIGTVAHLGGGDPRVGPAEVAGATLEQPAELTRAALDRGADAVWRLEAEGCGVRRQGSVTVVELPSAGVVGLTNVHVVEGAGSVRVHAPGGRTSVVTVLGAVPRRDVAVIDLAQDRVLGPLARAAALELGPSVGVGSPVAVLGHPGGVHDAAVATVRSRELRSAQGGTSEVLVIDAPVRGGSSGGAVVDASGAFVALVAARDPGTGDTVAYPAEQATVAATERAPSC